MEFAEKILQKIESRMHNAEGRARNNKANSKLQHNNAKNMKQKVKGRKQLGRKKNRNVQCEIQKAGIEI